MTVRSVVILLSALVGLFGLLSRAQQSDPDAAVLEQLKKAGSNLSKPHKIDFYLYFPDENAARRAAKEIKDAGFGTEVRPAATGSDWLCLATKTMVPELSSLKKIRSDFTSLANAEKGEYDGWEAAIVK